MAARTIEANPQPTWNPKNDRGEKPLKRRGVQLPGTLPYDDLGFPSPNPEHGKQPHVILPPTHPGIRPHI